MKKWSRVFPVDWSCSDTCSGQSAVYSPCTHLLRCLILGWGFLSSLLIRIIQHIHIQYSAFQQTNASMYKFTNTDCMCLWCAKGSKLTKVTAFEAIHWESSVKPSYCSWTLAVWQPYTLSEWFIRQLARAVDYMLRAVRECAALLLWLLHITFTLTYQPLPCNPWLASGMCRSRLQVLKIVWMYALPNSLTHHSESIWYVCSVSVWNTHTAYGMGGTEIQLIDLHLSLLNILCQQPFPCRLFK